MNWRPSLSVASGLRTLGSEPCAATARSRFRRGELHASTLRSTPPSTGERSATIRVALAGGPHELSTNSPELEVTKTTDEATDGSAVADSSSSAPSEVTSDAESTFDAVGDSTGFADGASGSRRGIATDDSTSVFRSPGDRSATGGSPGPSTEKGQWEDRIHPRRNQRPEPDTEDFSESALEMNHPQSH